MTPTDRLERALLSEYPVVIGMDEVGRGALAGPVTVGAVAMAQGTPAVPEGIRDSKALTARGRDRAVAAIEAWAPAALGWSTASAIDRDGIVSALAAASVDAVRALGRTGVPVDRAVVVLDGTHDWLTPSLRAAGLRRIRVLTQASADRDCATVAAASCVAKVARDAHMIELSAAAPQYGWASNKGYGAAAHRAAILMHGPHPEHRRTWLTKLLGEPLE